MFKNILFLFILILLVSCKHNFVHNDIPLNYIRLQKIYVDCENNTYGECIIKYDNALKKSNQDKEALKNYFN